MSAMPVLCANLSTLFRDTPFASRFERAAGFGFSVVEMQYPYEMPPNEIAGIIEDLGQSVALFNAPLGDEPVRRGLACQTETREAFRDAFLHGADYAQTLGCGLMHVLSGVSTGTQRNAAEEMWLENFAWAAHEAQRADLTLVIEALNPTDVPGYFLRSIDHAITLIEQVNSPHLRLLFDTYHCAMSGRDCVQAYLAAQRHVAHVQIADVPGRAEPGTGSIDWDGFFASVRRSGFEGLIGCEFFPSAETPHCFEWVRQLYAIERQH
jgi:hydroxypyruvate isomerase